MPGILGLTSVDKANKLPPMEDALFKSPYVHYQRCDHMGEAWGVVSLRKEKASIEHRNVKLAFEGYIINGPKPGKELLVWLVDLFLENGKSFAKELRGSFQIVIKYEGTTFLYVDHTCSRPLFFLHKNSILYFSPEIAPIMVHQERADLDEANLIQFIIAGHFFSGDTLARQIKNLRPGEFLVFDGKALKRNNYYVYDVTSDKNFDRYEAIERLNRQLENVIVGQWKIAENPGILLSGGLDSRYIFHTIADYVDDTTQLKTICWGEDSGKDGTDVKISTRLAERFGTKQIIIKRNAWSSQSSLLNMFYAQSGMTDSVAIHADELEICKQLREEHGIKSLFRGDHSFGSFRERTTIQHGLLDLGMSLTEHIANKDQWFSGQKISFFESYSNEIGKALNRQKSSPNDIRDTLRFYERLPMYLHQLNYFKYHYQEVHNPYLEKSVLDISRSVPSDFRANKKLLKECYQNRFRKEPHIPFARKDDMINWDRAIARSPTLYEYLEKTINALPDFFNKIYFQKCLSSISNDVFSEIQNSFRRIAKREIKRLPLPSSFVESLRGNAFVLSPSIVTLRLAVISIWFKLWIK